MATADEYATWIVNNADKKGTPEFATVAAAYQDSKAGGIVSAKQPKEEGMGARVSRELSDIPRQLGLTARAMIKGPADVVGIFSNPIASLLSQATGKPMVTAGETADQFSNYIGLPKPESTTEKVVGKGAEMMAGMGGQALTLAKLAATSAPSVAQKVYAALSANPTQQLAAATGGGTAGEYVKETGGGPGAQVVASLVGSVGGAGAASATGKIYNALSGWAKSMRGSDAQLSDITVKLDSILADNGLKTGDIPASMRSALSAEVKSAMDTGKQIRPDVVKRIADYALVGAKPMRGNVTLDPAQITQERNLMKLGANSSDKGLQEMAQTARNNDMKLTGRLNDLGAGKASEPVAAGAGIQSTLKAIDAPRKAAVDAAYQAVRDSSGRAASLDVPAFSKMANDALDEQMLGSVLPSKARALLNDVSSGKIPLNVNTSIQMDKVLSGLSRDSAATGDKQGALAIRQVRDALNKTPVENAAGERALTMYDKARQMAAQRFAAIENNPAMAAALDDAAPDKFVSTYIIGSGGKANQRDVFNLVKDLKSQPDAMQSAKEQIMYHLKQKALSGNADEVGNFSPSAYNKALNAIGDTKLKLFFTKDEFNMIKAVGRVSSYEKFQPTGSAVNNSNSASAFASVLEKIAASPLVSRIPFGGAALGQPAQQWSAQIQSRQAMSPLRALMQPQQQAEQSKVPLSALLLPALAGMQN